MIKRIYVPAKPGPCPFTGIAFKDVPLYDEGYGCPCCKGLRGHLDINQREANVFNWKMIDAELTSWVKKSCSDSPRGSGMKDDQG